MRQTSFVIHLPASNESLLLTWIFLNPCHFGGGGSISLKA